VTPISEANLLCVHIADAPEVKRRVQALMTRVECQETRIECLLAEVEQLTRQNQSLRAGDGQPDDAATRARLLADAYANRH